MFYNFLNYINIPKQSDTQHCKNVKKRQLLHKRAEIQYKKLLQELEKAKINKIRFTQKSEKFCVDFLLPHVEVAASSLMKLLTIVPTCWFIFRSIVYLYIFS